MADASKGISANITLLTKEMGEKIRELNQLAGEANLGVKSITDIMEAILKKQDTEGMNLEEVMASAKEKIAPVDEILRETIKYFRSILSPLTDLINIARQTNLLGVRAAIEAAHSTNDKTDFDELLDRHMTTEAKLAALLVERTPEITVAGIKDLGEYSGIGEFWITDEHGVVDLTNVDGGVGFTFTNEGQTAPYMRILANPDLVVTAPPAIRTLDNKVFKFAAVARRGKTGIFQIGNPSKLYGDSTAEGFSVVSKQIKDLADQSKVTTQEIEELIRDMDARAHRALDVVDGIGKNLPQTER